MYVKIGGEMHYLWLPVDHEGRWEHEAVLEAMQARRDRKPAAMRSTGPPSSTLRHAEGLMGATHFKTKPLANVGTETSLQVLAYNLKYVIELIGVGSLIAASPPDDPSPRNRRGSQSSRVLTQPGPFPEFQKRLFNKAIASRDLTARPGSNSALL
jgi:hypothetical protein